MADAKTKAKKTLSNSRVVLIVLGMAGLFFLYGGISSAEEMTKVEKLDENKITLYKDIFDQSFYSEAVNQLDFGRWGRKIFRKKIPSANVNVFDEVPDSNFFINRHERQKLSLAELEKGFCETKGPDLSRPLTLVAAEQQDLHFEFVVEDAAKDQYILRFDRQTNLELNTAAEVIASRFYHAIGYNVPQYTILFFKPEQITIGKDAITCDNSGFVKKLDQIILMRYLVSIPQTPDGFYRASANKVPAGESLGSFSFWSRRKNDPSDPVNHRDRREIRTLGIFSSWLNDYGIYESDTIDMLEKEGDQTFVQHYLASFTNALGAYIDGPKPPMFGYEHMVDYGEIFKTILAFGFREKPWQKKWRAAEQKPHPSPAVGYFSNQCFDPAKYKTELPYEAFRVTTRADGFWAAKIMASFSDEDIRSLVKAGHYTDPEASDYIANTLIERRDIITRYWFSKVAPLDGFEFSNSKLSFKDLAADQGFEEEGSAVYLAEIFESGKHRKTLAKIDSRKPELTIDPSWFKIAPQIEVVIKALRPDATKKSSAVVVLLTSDSIQGIHHED